MCTSRWAGAGLPLSYAAFISLAGLGGSCNKPLSTLPFSYVFIQASRLSRSGPSSTQSDFIRLPLTDFIGISCLQPCFIRPFISWLGSVVRLEAQLSELALSFYFFRNSIAVSEVLLDRWSSLALVLISSRFFWKARYSRASSKLIDRPEENRPGDKEWELGLTNG